MLGVGQLKSSESSSVPAVSHCPFFTDAELCMGFRLGCCGLQSDPSCARLALSQPNGNSTIRLPLCYLLVISAPALLGLQA